MPDYVKRCQSRVKQITKSDSSIPMAKCREVYGSIVANWNEPSEEELGRVVQALIDGGTVEVEPETTEIEPTMPTPETFDIPVEDMPCLQPPDETEAIAPIEKEEQIERQTNPPSPMQEPEALAPSSPKATGIVPQQSNPGIIPQGQVREMVSSAFANQPQDFKDQVTEYALQHSFDNVRQVQEFLEQLRGMEFNLLVNTLNDHFQRRGSMLTLLEEVIEHQKQKEGESNQNFFNSFNNRLTDFQKEMQSRLSKTGI